jgi:hypothetical protein
MLPFFNDILKIIDILIDKYIKRNVLYYIMKGVHVTLALND